ncbi:MAG TPA: hypothetical protein VMD08_13915 [Candidatus Baltobacteraceae bacterium]|nr:hypothetical protein [Candidatus Baltobacteraceae bacterium]
MKLLLDVGVLMVNVLTMAAVGMDLEGRHFREVMHKLPLLVIALVAQTIGLPLIGWAILQIMGLPPHIGAGILLVAACPIGNIANFYCLVGRTNLPLSVGLTVASIAVSLGTMPLTFAGYGILLGEQFALATPAPRLVLNVFLMLVMPVLGGMVLRRNVPVFVARYTRSIQLTGLAGVAFLLLAILVNQRAQIATEWPQTVTVSALFMGLALAGGLACGRLLRLAPTDGLTIGISCAVRSVALALAVAITVLDRVEYAAFAAVYFLIEIPLLLIVAGVARRRTQTPESLGRSGQVTTQ